MEKKTGRSRKAVQSLKPKKLVYWAVAIPAFLALLLFAIVFLDHSDNDISRAMASKAMALSFADRDDIVASQGEHGSHFGTPDQDEWYAKYIDYMIEEGYLEPGDEKISKSYAMGALTYGEAAYAADRVSKGLSSALNVSKNKYKKAMPKEEWWLFYESFLKKADSENAVKKQKLVLYGTPKNVKEAAAWTAYTDQGTMNFEACRWMPASIGRSRSMSVMVRSSRCAAYSLKKLHIRMSGSFRENRVGWMCILARSSGHFQRKKSSRIVPMECWRM